MSWSIRYESKADFESDKRAFTQTGGNDPEGVVNAIEAARRAASLLIGDGAVGGDTKDFTVSLSGHANKDHEPAPGWANDTITVTVTQK